MGKSTYQVSWVEGAKAALWRDLWRTDGEKPSHEAREANKDGSLGQIDLIEAANLSEAISIVRKKRPNCVINTDACGRIG